jgi:Rps23 Pro-64 3,4-dihydroxylase Tpa1-like proline 4-hydroxylase
MKLMKCIEDKFFYFQNFLPEDEYKRIHKAVIGARKKFTFEKVGRTWDKFLYQNLEEPTRINTENGFFSRYQKILGNLPYAHIDVNKMKFIIHSMGNKSGINWHADEGHNFAITLYLNNRWNFNWGGEFMYQHEGEFNFIPIVGNSVVIIKAPLIHKVNTVLSPIIPRLSIQSFVAE